MAPPEPPRLDLSGRRVLVTGAARGIGAATRAFAAAAGAETVAWDLDGEVDARVDVSDRAAVSAAFDRLERAGRRCDALVNAAGINKSVPFLELSEADWRRVIEVNLSGTFHVGQLWAQRLVAAGAGGAAVNVASLNIRAAVATGAHYAASKGGVDALTRGMAVALAPHGIRVNAVAPGPIRTDMTRHNWATPEGTARLLNRVLLGRLGTAEEVAALIAFLLCPLSAWTTGSTFHIDGGVLAVR